MDLDFKVAEELDVSQRIVRAGSVVLLRFRIFCPDDEHVAFVDLPEDESARLDRLNVMRMFMVYKAAAGFLLSSELITPNALLCVAVTRTECFAALQPIKRDTISFGKVRWLPPAMIDDEIISLLPPRKLDVTREELEFMRHAFEEREIEGITWQPVGS